MTSRALAGADDLQPIIDLLSRVRPPERVGDYPSPTDLYELLSLPAVQANTRLWFDKGQIVAFALVDSYHNLAFECQEANPDLQAEITNWGVECIAATLYAIRFYLALGYRRSAGVRTGWSFEGRGLKVQPVRKVLRKS